MLLSGCVVVDMIQMAMNFARRVEKLVDRYASNKSKALPQNFWWSAEQKKDKRLRADDVEQSNAINSSEYNHAVHLEATIQVICKA